MAMSPVGLDPVHRVVSEEALVVIAQKGIEAMRDFMSREPTNQEVDKLMAVMATKFRGWRLVEAKGRVEGEPIH
jgi:hypothetical protein